MKKVQEKILFSQYLAETRLHHSSSTGFSKENDSRLAKKANSAARIQTGFFQCRYKLVSFQLPLTTCLSMSSSAHFQNPCCPACQNFHAICEHDVPNSGTPKVGQEAAVPSKSRHSNDSTDSNWCFYLFFILAEGISNTQMPFSFLNLLTFLQQKRAFRATYMQIMTHEFKVTLPCKTTMKLKTDTANFLSPPLKRH